MSCQADNTRVILWALAAILGSLSAIIGNVLAINIVYFFTRRGRRPTKRPAHIWMLFYLGAIFSVGLGALAAFAPSVGSQGASINMTPQTTKNGTLQPLAVPDICFGPTSKSAVNENYILFAANLEGKFELYKIHSDGSSRSQLTVSSEINQNPACSPDGSEVAFDCGPYGEHDVCMMNVDGSNLVHLVTNSTGPTWSPDGKRLAFTINNVVQMINLEDSAITQLTGTSVTAKEPAWSPGGNSIAFISPNLITNAGDVYLLDVLNKESKRIVSLPSYLSEDLEWSPSGRCLGYTTLPSIGTPPQVQVLVPETGEIHSLIDGIRLAWSPDGQSIAVSQFLPHPSSATSNQNTNSSTTDIVLLNLRTGDTKWITRDPEFNTDVSWCSN